VVAGCRTSGWPCTCAGGPGRATSAPRWPGIIVRGGFATFADTPITAAETAEAQLRTIAEGAEILHRG
jgi:hypothetical protein